MDISSGAGIVKSKDDAERELADLLPLIPRAIDLARENAQEALQRHNRPRIIPLRGIMQSDVCEFFRDLCVAELPADRVLFTEPNELFIAACDDYRMRFNFEPLGGERSRNGTGQSVSFNQGTLFGAPVTYLEVRYFVDPLFADEARVRLVCELAPWSMPLPMMGEPPMALPVTGDPKPMPDEDEQRLAGLEGEDEQADEEEAAGA